MEWNRGDRGNIEDMRGRSGARMVPMAGMGIGGVLLLLVLSWVSGTNLFSVFGGGGGSGAIDTQGGPAPSSPAEERTIDMVDAIAGDVQDTWEHVLGNRYERTKVVIFHDSFDSACGTADAATGPFYCPNDHKVYLDTGFFDELDRRFGAPGDFAQAYVVAHEFGHHVQQLLGLDRESRGGSAMGPNSASVAVELQADCFAGIWGHAASQAGRFQAGHVELQAGDAEEGLRAAAAIGDDRLQKMSSGRVMPERFTHGSSAQRVEAFRRGFESGDVRMCER